MPLKNNNMENFDLINHVVPSGGWYCAVGMPPTKHPSLTTKFTKSLEELQKYFDDFSSAGQHVYFGLAKYGDDAPLPKDSGGGRTAANAEYFKALWLDIDCGEDKAVELEKSTGQPKGYATKQKAEEALEAFCDLVDLPAPTLVDSGNGIHAYWAFTEELPKAQWLPLAARLKEICATQEFYVDRQVFDAARILRVPGTLNLKFDPPSKVYVREMYDPVDVELIRGVLGVEETAVAPTVAHTAKPKSTNPLEASLEDDPPHEQDSHSSFEKIMRKGKLGCAQLVYAYQERKTLPEPMWWNALSIAAHCSDSATAIHRLSKGHPDYDYEAVERKAAGTKWPHSCAEFAKEYPAGCKGCIHSKGKDKIRTPRELGEYIDCDTAPLFELPEGYYRGAHGGIYTDNIAGQEGKPNLVYPYDLYVMERMVDTVAGDVARVRVTHPHDGEKEFPIPNTSLGKQDLRKELARNGVVALEPQSTYITTYITKCIMHLRDKRKAETMEDQFGWKENYTKFIVGEREITVDGVGHSPASSVTEGITPHFQPRGTLDKWQEVFNLYDRPGLEIQAFAALSGFGSVLLEFTGQKGALINLVHTLAGTGKTTVLRVINSICGHPEMLLGTPDDTYLARITRLGVLNNIANTMDELTNMDDDDISPFIYACSQGKGKERMQKDKNANRINKTTWRALSVSTANAGFGQKLSAKKNTPDGEMMRLLEFNVPPSTAITTDEGKHLFDHQLLENYGLAIVPFIQYIIGDLEEVKKTLSKVQALVDQRCGFTGRERNWSAALAINFTAGIIANREGIIKLNTRRLFKALVPAVKQMKKEVTPPQNNDATILGAYILKHHGSILVVDSAADKRTGKAMAPDLEPLGKGKPVIRYESDTKRLYTPVADFKKHCIYDQVDYGQLIKRYKNVGFCLGSKNVCMDKGMQFSFGTVRCVEFDCAHPQYGIDVNLYTEGDTSDSGESEVSGKLEDF